MSADAPLQQPIPLARSILWSPVSGGPPGVRPGDLPFPIFLAQSAVVAIHEHFAAPPPAGQGLLGFLVGDLCECPETSVSYLVIDAALRLSQPIYADRTTDVVTRIWDRIEAQAAEAKGHLIGWYHSHPPLPLTLSAHDIETHEHYFAEPWQLALVVGSGPDGEPVCGFFRAGSDEAWSTTLLPFYELLSEESVRPGGKKRSFVTWKNYRAYNPPRPQRAAPPSAQPRPVPEPSPPPVPPVADTTPKPPPKSDELVFLTTAQDFVSTPPPRPPAPPRRDPGPRRLPTPPPPPRRPAPEPQWEAPPESEEAADTFAEPADQLLEEPFAEEPPARPRRAWRLWRPPRGLWVGLVSVLLVALGGGYVWLNGLPPLPELPSMPRLPSLPKVRLPALPKVKLPALPKLPFPKRQAPPERRVSPPASGAKRPAPGSPPTRGAAPPSAPAPFTRLDRVADSLAQAVRSFGDRAGLFDRRQLACDGLARGLLAVEDRWVVYSTARRASGVLDPAHALRDQSLYGGVDSVERRFEKSACPRP